MLGVLFIKFWLFCCLMYIPASTSNNNNPALKDKLAPVDSNYLSFHRNKNRTHTKLVHSVNGLKNNEVAFLIHSTWAKEGQYFRNRVYPAIRTWMTLSTKVYVLIEDHPGARLAFRNCPYIENENFTSFRCQHEPTVIMSRVCGESTEWQEGNFCCKVEDVVRYLAYTEPYVYKNIKYALIGDDDYYFRVDRIMEWLSYVDNAHISHLPLIANSFTGYDYARDRMPDCKEIVTYGWYGCVMFNKLAMDRIAAVGAVQGFKRMCVDWNMAQDVGLGILGWQLEFHHINLPGGDQVQSAEHKGENSIDYLKYKIAIHHTYHLAHRDQIQPCDYSKWPASLRYNQEAMIGCGSLRQHAPHQTLGLSAYQLWSHFPVNFTSTELFLDENFWTRSASHPFPVPIVHQLRGYNNTKHWEKTKDKVEFTLFHKSDCENLDV